MNNKILNYMSSTHGKLRSLLRHCRAIVELWPEAVERERYLKSVSSANPSNVLANLSPHAMMALRDLSSLHVWRNSVGGQTFSTPPRQLGYYYGGGVLGTVSNANRWPTNPSNESDIYDNNIVALSGMFYAQLDGSAAYFKILNYFADYNGPAQPDHVFDEWNLCYKISATDMSVGSAAAFICSIIGADSINISCLAKHTCTMPSTVADLIIGQYTGSYFTQRLPSDTIMSSMFTRFVWCVKQLEDVVESLDGWELLYQGAVSVVQQTLLAGLDDDTATDRVQSFVKENIVKLNSNIMTRLYLAYLGTTPICSDAESYRRGVAELIGSTLSLALRID